MFNSRKFEYLRHVGFLYWTLGRGRVLSIWVCLSLPPSALPSVCPDIVLKLAHNFLFKLGVVLGATKIQVTDQYAVLQSDCKFFKTSHKCLWVI